MTNGSDDARSSQSDVLGNVSRRRVLSTAAVVGVAGGATSLVGAQEDEGEIELEGYTAGWEGVAPADIEGETNPTISLESGEDYTVTWTNGDGIGHNFNIEDADGNVLVESEFVSEEGGSTSVEFTASEEMAEYFCQPHPQSMRGDVQIEGDDEEEPEEEPEEDEEEEMETPEEEVPEEEEPEEEEPEEEPEEEEEPAEEEPEEEEEPEAPEEEDC